MISCIADNIISPLGWDSEDNLEAVLEDRSELKLWESRWEGQALPFVASLFGEKEVQERFKEFYTGKRRYTRFEMLLIMSVARALAKTLIDPSSEKVIFVISSTKGNVELLDKKKGFPSNRVLLGVAAREVAGFFGNRNTPIVVSNACISGVNAQIFAARLLEAGLYEKAVVCGCDVVSKFVVSGFQSFKALSLEPCRPYDKDRAGLNLGEAAATMILSRHIPPFSWNLVKGAIRNDANHISGPSRTGEGSFRALVAVKPEDGSQLASVSVHGTATAYNDEMESIALQRAGLSGVPIAGLKGYYGHTLGAAGLLETILTMKANRRGLVFATRGFAESGVSRPVNISNKLRWAQSESFIKLLSGFGGCNAAALWSMVETPPKDSCPQVHRIEAVAEVSLHSGGADLDTIYKEKVGDYPKYYKMDSLSRLGFLASGLLARDYEDRYGEKLPEETAVVFVGVRGCLARDREYQKTIQSPDNYFPSPAVFVYTLPNIVTGEVAIRHHFFGESAFYLIPSKDRSLVERILSTSSYDEGCKYLIGGFLDYEDEGNYEAELKIYKLL